MKKSIIHMTPAEKLANTSASTVSAIEKNTEEVSKVVKAVQSLHDEVSTDVRELNVLESIASTVGEINDKEAPTEMKVTLAGVSVVSIKGDKGDTPSNETLTKLIKPLIPVPIKGEKGDSPTNTELVQLIKPLIPPPLKGSKGDSIKGDKGESPTNDELTRIIQPLIPAPLKGTDGSPDTGDQIIEKVNDSKAIINAERVRGLATVIREVERIGTNPVSVGGGKTVRYLDDGTEISQHVTELNFGTNLTGTYAGNGRVTINGSGSGGGHVIKDEGTAQTQRTNLNFVGAGVAVTDDAGNDATIVTINGGAGSGITRTVSSIAINTAAGSTASTDYEYLCTGTITLTLPTAIGNTNLYTATNVGSNTITVATTAAQTINGSATATLPIANMSLDFISDNANWHVT